MRQGDSARLVERAEYHTPQPHPHSATSPALRNLTRGERLQCSLYSEDLRLTISSIAAHFSPAQVRGELQGQSDRAILN
jgi:hypothetical protein